MSYIEQMLEAHPRKYSKDGELWVEGITANWSCAESCVACADACLGEEDIQTMRHCIRTCLDCADVCQTTAKLLTRQTESDSHLIEAQLQGCVIACQICGAECEKHSSKMAHCRVCAEACHRCEEACKELSGKL
jgi:Domain of Unknown Function (DUF326)